MKKLLFLYYNFQKSLPDLLWHRVWRSTGPRLGKEDKIVPSLNPTYRSGLDLELNSIFLMTTFGKVRVFLDNYSRNCLGFIKAQAFVVQRRIVLHKVMVLS